MNVLMIKKKNFKTLTMEGALEPVLISRPLKAVEVAVGMKDKRGDIDISIVPSKSPKKNTCD